MDFLLSTKWTLLAAEGDSALSILFQHLLAALIFSVIGVAVFALGIWIVAKVLPFSLRKELEEDQNTAVAIIVGAMLIGISMIIAAAIQG
jgi:uncharacterized membrane protein YjfL (UPF0719 family)